MTDRPSFILFITDQQRADYLGCYGHRALRTPNIDRLAERGVAFDKFFVASPVCMPNRASLMTCRMPSSPGVRCNGIRLSRRNVTFVELLREAGYDTALIGKSHLMNFTGKPPTYRPPEPRAGFFRAGGGFAEAVRSGFDDPFYLTESPGFWRQQEPTVPTPYYGFDHTDLVTGHGVELGGDYRIWLEEKHPETAAKLGAVHQLPHDYTCPQAVRTPIPEELYSTRYMRTGRPVGSGEGAVRRGRSF